jgi:hypothetical protein
MKGGRGEEKGERGRRGVYLDVDQVLTQGNWIAFRQNGKVDVLVFLDTSYLEFRKLDINSIKKILKRSRIGEKS